jgi:hypothetical protein
MKTLLWGGIIAGCILVALVVGGCDSKTTGSDEEYAYASVRFVHSAPSTEQIDFAYLVYNSEYYDNAATEASYGDQYGYFLFVAGSRSFRAYLSGTSLSVASITIPLAENGKYTIVAGDLEAAINPSLLEFADTTVTPDSGKAFLRFIHVSADAPDLDILRADSSALVVDLKQYQASPYFELDAGTYEFSAVSYVSGTELLKLPPFTLTSGISYSVILSGTAYSLPGSPLNAVIYQEMGVE